MRETDFGVEIIDISNEKLGVIYFDNGDMVIAFKHVPVKIRNISQETLSQIADFFYYRGNNPENSANRIDFNDCSFRIEDKNFQIITGKKYNKVTLSSDRIGLSEMKKIGIYLRKRKKLTTSD